MQNDHIDVLKAQLCAENLDKLLAVPNPKLHRFVADAIERCAPDSVFVCTDSADDIAHLRQLALDQGEERALRTEGHTIHYDGCQDQARDKPNTKYLVPKGMDLGAGLNAMPAQEGREEIHGILNGIMKGRCMIVRFLCLGPTMSDFAIPVVQITDSAYVAHSESLLYRPGYEQFRTLGDSPEFFCILHSAGELDERKCSTNVHQRRIYIDIEQELVYSLNTQYAGNTVGLKKLSLRLAIRRAAREGWLAEHMFLLGVNGPAGRVTYFAGAFPSMCGKTSTAMLKGERILGDDLAYLRKRDGAVYGANVECGIFGIIQDVNPKDDPTIWKAITSPREVIFSNVLVADSVPYWLGDDRVPPERGTSYCGEWTSGMKDEHGKPVPHAHKNARYTIRQAELDNCDPNLDNPEGVPVAGLIYGGRDSDISVPVEQSLNWAHGVVIKGAAIESETTAATLGKEGVRVFNPMSNIDFLSMPVGSYVRRHLEFPEGLDHTPIIFAVNYFQRDHKGDYLTGMHDKRVWAKWMERRVHREADAIETPTGHIPLYEDLKALFKSVLDKDYSREQYVEQFSCRVSENLAKLDRIEAIYRDAADTPADVFEVLAEQRARLQEAQAKFGDRISSLAY